MRRTGLGGRQGSAGASTPASSSVPSKATSEAGLEITSDEGFASPGEGTPNKDKSKPTREEREAQYKAARERIFGDFQESVTSESASTGENSASMSRSSSSSGKRKARKQKTPKDDSFEARSAYIPSYAPMSVSNMQPHYQSQYGDQSYHGAYQAPSNGYGPNINYGTTPTQAYPGFDSSMAYNTAGMSYGPNSAGPFSPADSWSSMQSPSSNGYYNYQASPSTYQQNMPPLVSRGSNQYVPPAQAALSPQPQNWMNNQYQGHYQQPANQANSNANGWPAYQPTQPLSNQATYGYGQMPTQNFGGNPSQGYSAPFASQTSNARSLFNPQTRSFVPGTAASRNGGRNNGRKRVSPVSSQTQSRNNSMTAASKSFGSDTSATPPPSAARGFERAQVPSGTAPPPRNTVVKEDSLQQKYGAPAHLPKKPPPPQGFSSYDPEGSNSSGSAPLPLPLTNPQPGSHIPAGPNSHSNTGSKTGLKTEPIGGPPV
jgi:hypothetical protein